MFAVALPVGLVVFSPRSRATSAQPFRRLRSINPEKSSIERLSRSNLATMRARAAPLGSSSSACWMPGLFRSFAEKPPSWTTASNSQAAPGRREGTRLASALGRALWTS
jgi:hypothetical protein